MSSARVLSRVVALLSAVVLPWSVSASDAPPSCPALLQTGETVVLRVRQVIPCDGLSQGERLLNSLPAVQPGDSFVAEVLDTPGKSSGLIGGTVTAVTRPGRFGRPGHVQLELAQVLRDTATEVPWQFHVEDQRFTPAQRRLLTTLFVLEGAGIGASIGAQAQRGRSGAVLAGTGAGLLLGLAYASLQHGREASLEVGDTFRVVVGAVHVETLTGKRALTLYPAHEAARRKGKP